ncbi:MAG TPA: ornithine carbamoyltransferase [Nitrososphaerales archaeon]|nr:ornithine carbamoyltransferase [Nitrososphaerales archaeon]
MLRTKHLLTLTELDGKEVAKLLNLASKLKKRNQQLLKNKILAMIFQKPSTRTRVSFETAMFELGGHAINLTMNEIQLSRGETIEDTARTLSVYADAIAARVYAHSDVEKLAKAASVPVINMLSDLHHPCQALGDLLTIKEQKRKLNGLNLAWIGDGDNVCNSLIVGCALTGINVTVACPKGYEPYQGAVEFAKSAKNGSTVQITNDAKQAVRNADIVYTDSFVSMGKESEKNTRLNTFLPDYQVNAGLMSLAKRDSIFMHCLPAKRGEEVTNDVMDSKQSVVWQQAENRLHAQKALLCMLLKIVKGL